MAFKGINWQDWMGDAARHALALLLVLALSLPPFPARAATPVSDSTLLFQISGNGPSGQSVSIRFSTGPTQTVRIPSNGSFLLEAIPIGQPEEITGTISFIVNSRTTTLNLTWNRFDQTMILTGNSSPYARIDISGSVSGSFSANGSGALVSGDSDSPELEIDAGDFLGDARSIQLRITPTRYQNRVGWVATAPITVGMATNLPENPETYTPSSPVAANGGGGSGGDGDDIGQQLGSAVVAGLVSAGMNILNDLFSTNNLMASLGQKIDETWIDVWRSMSQQETTSNQQSTTAEASETDAEIANDAADEAADDQADTAEEIAPTEALCQMTDTARLAEGEASRDENQTLLAEETESTADINPASEDAQGRASRYCRYAASVPGNFREECEDAGHEVLDGEDAVVADPALSRGEQSAVDLRGGTKTDAAAQSEANIDLITDEHRSLTGVGEAAADPNRFEAVMSARSVTAVENLIKSSLQRTVALRAQGEGTGAETLQNILRALGYPDDYITQTVGSRPSYYSQLEIGTKLAYQDANFYTGLEGMNETQLRALAAGIDAQSTAQWREIYYAARQRELMLATILEAKLRGAQPRISAQLSGNPGAR